MVHRRIIIRWHKIVIRARTDGGWTRMSTQAETGVLVELREVASMRGTDAEGWQGSFKFSAKCFPFLISDFASARFGSRGRCSTRETR